MKYLILPALCLLAGHAAVAQHTAMAADSGNPDSSHVVVLESVTVNGRPQRPADRLAAYFMGNRNAITEDILARLPEVSLIRRGPYGMEPGIRNFTGGRINVLLDGMRIHGACTDKMDPPTIYIEPENLQEIRLQTGTGGAFLGSTTGGSLNFKLAAPALNASDGWHGRIGSGYQTASRQWYESATLNLKQGRWAVRANGTFRKAEDYRAGGGSRIPYSSFQKFNYGLSAVYELNPASQLRIDWLADDGRNIGYPALPMDVGSARARIGSVTWNRNDRSRTWETLEVKAYANAVHHEMDDSHRPMVSMHMDMPGESSTAGFYAEGTQHLNDKWRIAVRADGSMQWLKASMTMYPANQPAMYMLTWPDNRNDQAGLGSTLNWRMDSINSWRLTLRADFNRMRVVSEMGKDQLQVFGYDQTARNFFSKNIALNWTHKLDVQWQASASLSYNERIPTATELYGFYLFNAFDGYDYIGNPQLKPEQALEAEGQLAYQHSGWRVRLSGFFVRNYHYILGTILNGYSPMTIGARGVKGFENVRQADITGAELSVEGRIARRFDLVQTVKYSYGQYDGGALPLIAPLKSVTSARWRNNRLFVQTEAEWAAAQNRVNSESGEHETPGYYLLNIRAGYRVPFGSKQLSIQTGMENLLDRNYHEHLDWGGIPRPGRNVYVQVEFNW